MIEKVIYDFMNSEDSGMTSPTYTEVPVDPPDVYTTFERTSSRSENTLNAVTFAFQSTAPSLLETVMLNERVKEAILRLVSQDAVFGVRIQSDYNTTDTVTKKHRYTAVAVIYC